MTKKEILKKLASNQPGRTRAQMEAELKEIAKELVPFTGGKLKVPSLRELEREKVAKEDPEIETSVKDLLTAYRAEEKRITLNCTKKRKEIQLQLRQALQKLKDWATEQRKDGKSKIDTAREGDIKLQKIKSDFDKKLQGLKTKGFKEFDSLEREYKKKHSDFAEALRIQNRNQNIYRFVGKTFLSVTISFLVMVIIGLTIHTIVFLVFLKQSIGMGSGYMAEKVVEGVGEGIGKVVVGR